MEEILPLVIDLDTINTHNIEYYYIASPSIILFEYKIKEENHLVHKTDKKRVNSLDYFFNLLFFLSCFFFSSAFSRKKDLIFPHKNHKKVPSSSHRRRGRRTLCAAFNIYIYRERRAYN